jgi:putative MATE family efflux protein
MSIPTALGFLGQTIYDVVDMIWIGRISGAAVAGVTIFVTVFWTVEVLNEIIGISSVSLISQSYGAKNHTRTNRIIEQTLTFKALVAVLAMVFLLIFLRPLLSFLTQDGEVLRHALDYGFIRLFFLPVMFSSYTVNTSLRCIGDAKSPMMIMLFASILNAVLDPVFIFERIPGTSLPGLNLGVFGAGLATVISISVAFALGFYLLYSGKRGLKISLRGLLKLDWSIDYKLLTIGLPTGFEMLTQKVSWYIAMKIIATFGTVAVATIGIGNRFTSLLVMPLIGMYVGNTAIVGQNLGANQIDTARKTVKASIVVGVLFIGIAGGFSLLFPELIMRMFINDPAVIGSGISMIRFIAPGTVFLVVFYGFASAFGGAGYMKPFITSSVISRCCVLIPLLLVFILALKYPIETIWLTMVLTDAVSAVVMLLAYRQGKWETKRV